MPDNPRETGSDIFRTSGGRPSASSIQRDIARLEKYKADVGWVKGKLEVAQTRLDGLRREVDTMQRDIDGHGNELTEVAKMSASAETTAKEAKMAADSGHECVHQNTITTIKGDVTRITATVAGWDTTVRKATFKVAITLISAIVVFGSALTGWFVMHNDLAHTVEDQGEDLTEVQKKGDARDATLQRIEDKLEQSNTPQDIKAAFKEVYTEIKAEEAQNELSGRRRGRSQ